MTDRPRRDCQCPRANHQHGTRAAYEIDGCRCFPCTIGSHRYRVALTAGTPIPTTDYPLAVGTRRRVEALHAVGWSANQLAVRLGYTRRAVLRYREAEHVLRTTAERVAALYDELWDVPPPGNRANATRLWAARQRFLPPLAWDDDTIDNPDARPYRPSRDRGHSTLYGVVGRPARTEKNLPLDEIAIERAMHGDRVLLTRYERAELVSRLTAQGLSAREIAERIGVTSRTVVRKRRAA